MHVITDDKINIVIYGLKMLLINLGTVFIYFKLSKQNESKIKKFIILFLIIIMSVICTIVMEVSNKMNAMITTIIMYVSMLYVIDKNSIGYTIILTVLSVCISNIIFFMSVIINGIPNIVLKVNDDKISFIFITMMYIFLIYCSMKIKRLDRGISFINEKQHREFFDIVMLNISAMILFMLEILGNYNMLVSDKTGFGIIILSIIMFLTIKKSFDIYYKQKLLIKELEENKKEIEQKNQEIKKLEEENLNFSKKSHSLAHKQKSLEYKINQLALKTELSEELDIKEQFKNLSKELYTEPVQELDKTNIVQIDDMLKFMQSECIKNDIEFRLQIYGNIYHIITNIITKDQVEILIADPVKDAIIAIKHTDNINKSILVKLGKIEGCYGLYIYDSGVEFKKEILENLGKKPSTAYQEEGGTGMGFMNTFDTLKGCNGSLIIKELGKLSKDNYTKIIMIKFDGKNEFKVVN